MNDLKTRVAYLQGLSAGLDFTADSKEGKLLKGIIDVLDEFADSVGDLEEAQEQMEDYLENIDEDLYHLEDEIYEEDGLNTCAENYVEVDCPRCGETVCFDSEILEDDDIVEVTCPNCDEVVFVNDDEHQAADEPEALLGKAPARSNSQEVEDI
ncbi:MAG: CD1247 N-terminal domain-containing protein [Desulfotomaculaceae bacterium]